MNTENSTPIGAFIPDEKVQAALDELKKQGFELGRVYSNPYVRAFKPQSNEESSIVNKLKESSK